MCIEFEPGNFQQMAGLVCYYNTGHYHYLHITGNGDGSKKLLNILSCDKFRMSEPLTMTADLTGIRQVYLKVIVEEDRLQFYYGTDDKIWIKIGPVLDASILSDDYVREDQRYRPAFTGAFVGICCQDLTGEAVAADFEWFEYRELDMD